MRKPTHFQKPSRQGDTRNPDKSSPRPATLPRPGAVTSAPTSRAAASASPQTVSGTWLWGHHAVLAALSNPDRKLLRILATIEILEELGDRLAGAGIAPQIVGKDELSKMLPPGAVHQGLALLTRPLPHKVLEDIIDDCDGDASAVIIALDQVTDPHNIGAIMRSAAAFGARAILIPDRNAPEISGTLAKSASGAVEHVPMIRVVNLVRALEQLKKAGFWSVGLAGEAERTLAAQNVSGRLCLVLGSEGSGMRRLTREACDVMARLPTGGAISSLNVSNAAAVALYELRRAGG